MFVFLGLAILTLIARISASQSQVYMSHNRGYSGISVHIDADTGRENCVETLQNIKDMFTAGSLVLHRATNFTGSPVHFSQVTIVTPSWWSDSDCGTSLGTVNGNTLYKHTDILIVLGETRHTVQGAECGQPGHQILLPVSQLGSGASPNLLVSEWSRLRYGVYPELGWAGDNLYPSYYYQDGHVQPTGASNTLITGSWRFENMSGGCDPTQASSLCHFTPEGPNTGLICSLNTRPELPTVTEWCEKTDNSGPDMQSVLCGGRSVREVIAQHSDFATPYLTSTSKSQAAPPTSVTFSTVREPEPKYILILETSARMTAVWQSVRKAVVNLLRYEIPKGCEVGIVTFSSGASVRHSLTRLTADTNTRLRLSDSVPDTANKLSSSRVGCVRCGVRTAMDQLLRSREAGAHLIIITASEGEDSVSKLDLDSLTEYVDYYNIRLSSLVLHMTGSLSSHFTNLASLSAGRTIVVPVAGDSVSLLSGLVTSLETILNVDRLGRTYQTVAITEQSYENKTTEGHFVIDSMLGADSLFGVLVEDDENHHIKSVTFTDHQGAVFGPFTKMSSQLDDINLKTINFPVGLRPPFDEEARLGQQWKYHISWYEDPDSLDNVVMVRSRPRDGANRLEVTSWTNEKEVAAGGYERPVMVYVSVSVGGRPVVGAEVGLRILHISDNGADHSVTAHLTCADDGAADSDLTRGDGVYSLSLATQLLEPGTYQLDMTVSNRDNQTYIGSPLPTSSNTCCGSVMRTRLVRHTGAFIRHVAGPVIHRQTGGQPSPTPARVIDFGAEFLQQRQKLVVRWSVPDSRLEIESYTLSYSANINTVIRGDQTRDTVILARDIKASDGVITQVLPGPELIGIVYFTIRARDSAGGLGPISNILHLNITSTSTTSPHPVTQVSEYNYTLLGAVLGIITVFSLLTILAVSCWLQRRRHSIGKLRSLHGFSNKVSSGVNVVIDRSTSKFDSEPAVHHIATPNTTTSTTSSSANSLPPSATSFANNITPTYWSASQLLADHEHRKRDNPNNYHHHHHGHHYHQYFPVHHESHFEDHDSDVLEDNNNEHNTSDNSSSTIVMLNTSLSSGGTGSVRKKNITQV